MAYIIENSVILSAMSEKLQDGQQNVQIMYSSQINDIEFPQNMVRFLCTFTIYLSWQIFHLVMQ